MNVNACTFRTLTALPACGESIEIVDDHGNRLCEDHAVAMYPDIEGQGWPTMAVLEERAERRRFSTTIH